MGIYDVVGGGAALSVRLFDGQSKGKRTRPRPSPVLLCLPHEFHAVRAYDVYYLRCPDAVPALRADIFSAVGVGGGCCGCSAACGLASYPGCVVPDIGAAQFDFADFIMGYYPIQQLFVIGGKGVSVFGRFFNGEAVFLCFDGE